MKTCSLDPLPTKLVVEYLDVLLPIISRMINCSLEHGTFPDKWKETIETPLIKKPGLSSEYKNLCPISDLSYVSRAKGTRSF